MSDPIYRNAKAAITVSFLLTDLLEKSEYILILKTVHKEGCI